MHKKSWDEDDSQKEMIQNKIETYSPMVYRLAYALVKSRVDADDIHQEVSMVYQSDYKSVQELVEDSVEKEYRQLVKI